MKTLEPGTIKRIHVNRQVLAKNLKSGRNDPAITVQTSKGPIRASQATIVGTCHVRQAGIGDAKPLKCGARVWVETTGKVVL